MWNRQSWRPAAGLLILSSLLLMACGSGPWVTMSPISTAESSTTEEGLPPELQAVAAPLKQDLAENLAVPIDEIQVVGLEEVDWPSPALGCPQPGMSYADVITPGHRVILAVNGKTYAYHVGVNSFVLCERVEQMTEPEETPEPTPPLALGGTADTLVEQAKADLADRAGVPRSEITVRHIEAVEWRDSSLGCPLPGMNYLMVITPGYLIHLEAGGTIYEYHTSRNHVVLCQKPAAMTQHSPALEARLARSAQADLAKRLRIAADDVNVVKIEAVDWPDASLGCPQPGMMYAQMVSPGYRILLSVRGQEYDYRADLKRAFLCENIQD